MDRELAGTPDDPDTWGAATDLTPEEAEISGDRDVSPEERADVTECPECGTTTSLAAGDAGTCPKCGATVVAPVTRSTDAPAPPG